MIKFRLNGLDVEVEEGTTLLEAARFYNYPVPTLCYHETLAPYGACRMCVVEIGEGAAAKLVTSCTYPAQEGIVVRTQSKRVTSARKMLIEMYLATCPQSKTIQDLASEYGVNQVRFNVEQNDCILCGLCVRMCKEQMMAEAIGFSGRGNSRKVSTPFDIKSDVCRRCGGCIYICPACQMRCFGPREDVVICGSCQAKAPVCLDVYEDAQCWMDPCVWCLESEVRNQKSEIRK
jgi:NADH dehydrogenase/NADH:ubiquinone oxidoreductase subunit G